MVMPRAAWALRSALLGPVIASCASSAPNSSVPDAGDPCAAAGCALAPECGSACGSSCGCCSCYLGNAYCDGDRVLRCNQPTCYDVFDTCPAGACVYAPGTTTSAASCARSAADCPAIANAYAATVAAGNLTAVPAGSSGLTPGEYNFACSPIDCGIVPGHCDLGLGACWYLGRPQPQLDRLAALYQSLACATSTPCSCPPQQATATCETNPDGGSWVLDGGSILATYACVVP
jgi:hypothetical protein